MTNYPVGDFLIRFKNAALAGRSEFTHPENKKLLALSAVLKNEGYLTDYTNENKTIIAKIAFRRKKPVLFGLKLISRPGVRIYLGAAEIEKKKGPSTYLISSNKGIITSKEAIKKRLGGEIIAEIW